MEKAIEGLRVKASAYRFGLRGEGFLALVLLWLRLALLRF